MGGSEAFRKGFVPYLNGTADTSKDDFLQQMTGHEPLNTQFEAVFFERGGGDSFEVAILDDLVGSNDPTDFEIIGDGVLGQEVLDFTPGDFDLNDAIEFADFLAIANNFGTGTLYSEGDINFSGRVDLGDFVAFHDIFLSQGAGEASSVPEPSSTVLLQVVMLFGLTVLRRRR